MKLQTRIQLTILATVIAMSAVTVSLLLINRTRVVATINDDLARMAREQTATQAKDVQALVETNHQMLASGAKELLVSASMAWQAVGSLPKDAEELRSSGPDWLDNLKSIISGDIRLYIFSSPDVLSEMRQEGINDIDAREGTRFRTFVADLHEGKSAILFQFVDGAWGLSAYAPLKSIDEEVIGALSVRVILDKDVLDKVLHRIAVGKSGYIFILGGSGVMRGRYIVSLEGKRDGEDIWDAKDANGRAFIQSIVDNGRQLKRDGIHYERYFWKNEGDASLRSKISAISYFEEWDWLIGAGAYEDEFQDRGVGASLSRLVFQTFAGTLFVGLASAFVGLFVTRRISTPVREAATQLVSASRQLSVASSELGRAGERLAASVTESASTLEQTSASMEDISSMSKVTHNSIESLVNLLHATTQQSNIGAQNLARLVDMIRGISESSSRVGEISRVIDGISFQTNLLALNAAVEAARAGEHGKGFAVVADAVRQLAQKSASSAKEISLIVGENIEVTLQSLESSKSTNEAITKIIESVKKANELVMDLQRVDSEQHAGIVMFSSNMQQIDRSTQENASTAEQTAAVSTELANQVAAVNSIAESLLVAIGEPTGT